MRKRVDIIHDILADKYIIKTTTSAYLKRDTKKHLDKLYKELNSYGKLRADITI